MDAAPDPDDAGRRRPAHGALTVDTVLIEPEQHGVLLTGWTAALGGDGAALADLTDAMLAPGEPRQSQFMRAAQRLSPKGSWPNTTCCYDTCTAADDSGRSPFQQIQNN